MYTDYNNLYSSYLSHSGKKGMKWGIRNKKKQLNKVESKKKVNISDDKKKKQQDKLLKLYKQRKEANWYAANALIAAAITIPIGALMTTSYNNTIAKAGEALITSSGLAMATAGAYAGQSISLKNEQKRLQARYGHSLDESNMKYHPLKGTISYGQKGK
jgi:hypothetical protein